MLQFVGGIFVTNDNGMGMLLQAADGPHVVDRLFYAMAQGAGFIVAIHHNHHLLSVHHCADTYGQSGLRNQINIKSGSIINRISLLFYVIKKYYSGGPATKKLKQGVSFGVCCQKR